MEIINEVESSELTDGIPRVGMIFNSLQDAWNFWKSYGAKMGFNVRKHFRNEKTKGKITSRGFVCGNQGHREIDKRNREVKRPRAETRTGCLVHISLNLVPETQKYRIYDFCGDHNHALQRPEAVGLMPSQREIPESYGITIDLADDSGITPKEGYELMGREAGGTENLPFRKRDYVNHIRNKRKRELANGEATSMLRYFDNKTLENSSFRHIEKIENGKITNVFWADAKMRIDYDLFGDVITFDTTYGTNKQFRPLGVFVGFNHYREIVVFGATILYTESTESFKWLFETFLATHNNKYPKSIFTDQDPAMAATLEVVMPNTYHGLCTWHICKNALKKLTSKKKNEEDITVDGKMLLKEFKNCMYECDTKKEFEKAFSSILSMVRGVGSTNEGEPIKSSKEFETCDEIEVSKGEYEESVSDDSEQSKWENVNDNGKSKPDKRSKGTKEDWLKFVYKDKEKWAKCYMDDEVTLGMRSTQLSESFNGDLKGFLKWNLNIIRFFKQFDWSLKEKRNREIESEYEMIRKKPRIKVNVPILEQTADLYTPKIFEMFQGEWELSMSSFVKSKTEGQSLTEYNIGVRNFRNKSDPEKYFQVIANHTDQTVSCSCKKFKRWGILCGHALKVLDLMDIKLLPETYILKRWTREAKSNTVEDCNGRTIVENPKMDALCRYRTLARKLLKVAAIAADFEEVFKFVDATADVLTNKVDEKIHNISSNSKDEADHSCPTEQPDLGLDGGIKKGIPENFVENPISFKKQNGRKGGKRLTSWTDNKPTKKTVQKPANKKELEKPAKKKGQTDKSKHEGEPHKEDPSNLGTPTFSSNFQEYGYVNSYMDMLLV